MSVSLDKVTGTMVDVSLFYIALRAVTIYVSTASIDEEVKGTISLRIDKIARPHVFYKAINKHVYGCSIQWRQCI